MLVTALKANSEVPKMEVVTERLLKLAERAREFCWCHKVADWF